MPIFLAIKSNADFLTDKVFVDRWLCREWGHLTRNEADAKMSIRKYKDFLQKSNMKIENKRAREVNLIFISTSYFHINSRLFRHFHHAKFAACYGISYNDY